MKARAWLDRAIGIVGEHRVVAESAAIVVALVVTLLVLGTALHRRAGALNAERTRLERVTAIAMEWERTFQPASASEQLAWRRADQELGALGMHAPAQLELIRLVSARAEEVGIPETRVRLVDAGELGAMPDRSADTLSIVSADYAVSVEYMGSFDETLAYLSVLPPALEPQQISMKAENGRVRTTLVLTVYIVESHGTEPDSTVDATSGAAAADPGGSVGGPLGSNARAARRTAG